MVASLPVNTLKLECSSVHSSESLKFPIQIKNQIKSNEMKILKVFRCCWFSFQIATEENGGFGGKGDPKFKGQPIRNGATHSKNNLTTNTER